MEYTGSPSTPSKYQTKATENFHRLCQLFVTICSDLFREFIRFRKINLRSKLDAKREKFLALKLLSETQELILYPKSKDKQTDLKQMDLSLLCFLLRNICGIRAPKEGWGDYQHPSDFSIGACIVRIRVKRNVLFAHAYTGSIDTDSFEHNWGFLKDNILKIAEEIKSEEKYRDKVDELYTCTLNLSVTRKCFEIIKKMEGKKYINSF